MAMQNINSVLLGLVQMMNNFTTIDANKDGVISQDEVNIWAASVIPNASQEELPLYDIFTSQKTDGSKNELGAANFKALANGDDTVNNDDIARMQKFLTSSDKISLEQLLESLLKARDKANEGTNKAQESPNDKTQLQKSMEDFLKAQTPSDKISLEQLLESLLKAIDKLVEQGQLTQEKANELKAQAAEDPTKVWISLVGIGGNLTTSEKTMENTNPANPEDPASTLKRVNQAIDKLVEQGQLTQEKANELKAQAAEDPTILYGGQPLNRDETLELLVQNGTLTREQADKYKADNATLEEIKIVLKPTPFATMENTNPANPEDPASTLKRVNQAIDKLVEQGQLTQEKANELKAQAAEDPTKVWISLVGIGGNPEKPLVGIGGNLTTSEKTIEDRIKQACEEANKQAPGLNLNPQDWINNLSSETSLESILSTIKTNAMMYNNMNNPDSTSAETPEQTTEAVAIFIPDQTLMTKEIKLAGLALLENDFDKIDKDKDGILSKNEIKSWEKENVKKIGAGSYDENGNWVVDPVKEEQEKAYKVFYSGSTADNNFAELANGDDTVSLDDIIAMKSKLSTN